MFHIENVKYSTFNFLFLLRLLLVWRCVFCCICCSCIFLELFVIKMDLMKCTGFDGNLESSIFLSLSSPRFVCVCVSFFVIVSFPYVQLMKFDSSIQTFRFFAAASFFSSDLSSFFSEKERFFSLLWSATVGAASGGVCLTSSASRGGWSVCGVSGCGNRCSSWLQEGNDKL